jgi:hypothetical protein
LIWLFEGFRIFHQNVGIHKSYILNGNYKLSFSKDEIMCGEGVTFIFVSKINLLLYLWYIVLEIMEVGICWWCSGSLGSYRYGSIQIWKSLIQKYRHSKTAVIIKYFSLLYFFVASCEISGVQIHNIHKNACVIHLIV